VIIFTKDLACKWGMHNTQVNAIAPGWFPTDMSGKVIERNKEMLLAGIPAGRFGGPDDLKGAAVFLAVFFLTGFFFAAFAMTNSYVLIRIGRRTIARFLLPSVQRSSFKFGSNATASFVADDDLPARLPGAPTAIALMPRDRCAASEHQNGSSVARRTRSRTMRGSTAYFAGAGTVIAATVAGLGGGLLIGNIMSPQTSRQGTETTRLEQRMSPAPIGLAIAPSEPVPYLNSPQPSPPGTAVAAPTQMQTEAANSEPMPAQPADASSAKQPEAPAPQTAPPAAQPVAQAAAPEQAFARARDADVKRAEDKRRAERRQQWAERRRQRQQQELQAVEEKVREETEPRREFTAEPVQIEMPRIGPFGPE